MATPGPMPGNTPTIIPKTLPTKIADRTGAEKTLLNDEKEVTNTILHEIAHALTPGHHHDRVWKAKAREIGCTGDRCYSGKTVTTPESRYIAICTGCGHVHKKHRATRTTRTSYSCGKCSGGRYNPTYKLEYKLNPNY